jgi:dihydrofolate reductase
MPEIIVIAALAESSRAIGYQGKLPWSIPADLQRFKQLTLHHTVIMGRKTWEFDIQRRPLRQRLNIIITSQSDQSDLQPTDKNNSLGVWFVRSLSEALDRCSNQEKVFIMGGASIYTPAIDLADQLELTIVEGNYPGDVFFPMYPIDDNFNLVKRESREGYRFETYARIF